MPGRQFDFFGEESVLAAGPFGLFLDVQIYSTIGVFGVFGFGFGPCLDVQFYSAIGVVGVAVFGFTSEGRLGGCLCRAVLCVGGLVKLGVLGYVPPHSRLNIFVLAMSGGSAGEASGGRDANPIDLDETSASVLTDFSS